MGTLEGVRRAAGFVAGLWPVAAVFAAPPGVWTHAGGVPARTAAAWAGPAALGAPAWVLSRDVQGRVITFVSHASPVVSRELVIVPGSVLDGPTRRYSLYAVRRRDGVIAWASPVDGPELESWSSAAIQERLGMAYFASGRAVRAVRLGDGSLAWTRALPRPVVNASVLVTHDLGPAERLFITSFDGFGVEGELHAINISPRLGSANPFDPGQLIWSAPIGGSSGNTPAYADGRVFVSAVAEFEMAGEVLAFDARATGTTPAPIWRTSNTIAEGFYGGVAVGGGRVYAASYNFDGGLSSSNLLALDAETGAAAWSVPCNRTASTPVLMGGGRLLLSGGLAGFGSVPTVECFEDHGATAVRLWHSALDTWVDTDGDGGLDRGEFLELGGWTHVPAARLGPGGVIAFVGTVSPSGATSAACVRLSLIDLALTPASGGFVREVSDEAGGTPALAGANLYSVGDAGLVAFGPRPTNADVDGDGAVSIEDVYAWDQGRGERDVDGDGAVSPMDKDMLIEEVRGEDEAGAVP